MVLCDYMVSFVFSIDYELGLGAAGASTSRNAAEDLKLEKKMLPKILQLSSTYKIPLTFALPCHLLLEKCNGHKKLETAFGKQFKPIFDVDPKSNYDKNKEWYAPKLAEDLISKNHEIAAHSFMHVSYQKLSKEAAKLDLEACLKVSKKYNIKSFIFPRNEIKYLSFLKNYGFTHFSSAPGLRLPRLAKPKYENRLMDVQRTYFFNSVNQKETTKISAILNLARLKRRTIHFWTHLWNFKTKSHFDLLEKTFKKVNSLKFEKRTIDEITF